MKEYLNIDRIVGPLIFLSKIDQVSYGEIIKIRMDRGETRLGKVIRIEGDQVVAQVFEGTAGLSTHNASVQFLGRPFELALDEEILGRSFNGVGHPIDGGGEVYSKVQRNINGRPINPVARRYPRHFIQTGISSFVNMTRLKESSNGLYVKFNWITLWTIAQKAP